LSVHRQLRSRSIVVANPYEHMWEMFENHPQYHVRESPSMLGACAHFVCDVGSRTYTESTVGSSLS
jgi:hypothetical protein